MQRTTSDSTRSQAPSRSRGSGVVALLGAAATFVALIGITTVATSPRSLSDAAQLPPSEESFEVSPSDAPKVTAGAYAVVPAGGHHEVPGVQVGDDVYA